MASFTDHDHTFAAICSSKDDELEEKMNANGNTVIDAVNSRSSRSGEQHANVQDDQSPSQERDITNDEDNDGEDDETLASCDRLSQSSKQFLNNLLEPEVDLIEGDQSDETVNHNHRDEALENAASHRNQRSAIKQPNVLRRVLTDDRGFNETYGSNGNCLMDPVNGRTLSYNERLHQQREEEDDDEDNCDDGGGHNFRCRSLLCDSDGIIIAESIYRCIVCAFLSDSVSDARKHYNQNHMQTSQSKGKKCSTSKIQSTNRLERSNVPQSQQVFSNSPRTSHSNSPNDHSPSQMQMDMNDMDFETDDVDNFSEPDTSLDHSNYLDVFNDQRPKGKFVFSPSPADYVPGRNSIVKQSVSVTNTPHPNSSVRGGYVTCAVCSITKYYASVQRRYGQFTCMGCAKFFGRFLIKPRRYFCASLGTCPLDMTPRCKACLLLACINTYNIDEKRMRIVNANRPMNKSSGSTSSRSTGDSGSGSTGMSSSVLSSPGYQNNSSSSLSFAPPPLLAKSVGNASSSSQRNASSESPAAQVKGSPSLPLTSRPANNSTTVTVGRKGTGCRQCANCLADDCGKCNYCLDKPKFGGPNTLKKKCVQKKCLLVQPNTSVRSRSTISTSGLKDNNSISNSKSYVSHLR